MSFTVLNYVSFPFYNLILSTKKNNDSGNRKKIPIAIFVYWKLKGMENFFNSLY